MKRLITLLIITLSLTTFAKGPEITFQETEHDFGNIRSDVGKVSCVFTYTNTGDEPLALTTVTAPCGCTKPEFSAKPIAPGKSGEIKVTLHPTGMKGEFMKSITVRTNIKKGSGKKKVTLKIVGAVVPAK